MKFKTKIGKTLSYTIVVILLYNFICLLLLRTQWYKNNFGVLDYFDAPIYIFCAIHFFANFRKYNSQLRVCFFTELCYLLLKVFDIYFIRLDYSCFMFWNFLILSLPCWYWIENRLNK